MKTTKVIVTTLFALGMVAMARGTSCTGSDLGDLACVERRVQLSARNMPNLTKEEVSQLLENMNREGDKSNRRESRQLAYKSFLLLQRAFPYAN